MMAEDTTDCDSLCLDLDLLTPSYVRDSASGRCWGGSQCSGESTGLQTDDVMSSRDNPESESGVIGECSGYEQTSPPLSGKSECGNGRRKCGSSRRKTLSPGMVKSFFLADVELDEFSDPLAYPDPPSSRRVGTVPAAVGTNHIENSATPTAERMPDCLPPTPAGEDNHFASSIEVAGLLDTPKWSPTTATSPATVQTDVVGKCGGGMVERKCTPDGGSSSSRTCDVLTPVKGDQICSRNSHPVEGCENLQPASENKDPSPDTTKHNSKVPSSTATSDTMMDNDLNITKSNRRRSFEIGHVLLVREKMASSKIKADATMTSTTSNKHQPRSISLPLVPANATDGYIVPPAKEAGYSPESRDANDDVGILCREFIKSKEGGKNSLHCRRIAARIYCLTGYPLTPLAAQDCRVLCDASNGMKWRVGLDSDNNTDDEQRAVNGSSSITNIALKEPGVMEKTDVISKSEKRALIVRLKPVLDEMAVCVEMEKSAIELSTKICPRKLRNGAYEYVRCLDDDEGGIGMTVNENVFMKRYLAYVKDAKLRRLASANHFLTAMGRLHTEEQLDGGEETVSPSDCTTISLSSMDDQVTIMQNKRDRGLREAEWELWKAWEAALRIYQDTVQRCKDELRKEMCSINGPTNATTTAAVAKLDCSV